MGLKIIRPSFDRACKAVYYVSLYKECSYLTQVQIRVSVDKPGLSVDHQVGHLITLTSIVIITKDLSRLSSLSW